MDYRDYVAKVQKFFNKKIVRYSLPFLIMVTTSISIRDFEKAGLKVKKPGEVTLESEYEKIKDMDTESWVQKRGPRPWEEETMKQLPSYNKQ